MNCGHRCGNVDLPMTTVPIRVRRTAYEHIKQGSAVVQSAQSERSNVLRSRQAWRIAIIPAWAETYMRRAIELAKIAL